MTKSTHAASMTQSPWLDQTKPNLFRDEFRLIDDLEIDPWLREAGSYFKPIELYCWIHQHKGEKLFFNGLAKFVPMFPVVAYHGQVAVWTSPPPSGFGNAVYLVMGNDKNGQLRLVGGNYFTEPKPQSGAKLTGPAFFGQYDQGSQRDQFQLIKDTIQASIQPHDKGLLWDIRRECEHFHTMAVYITVLTDRGSMFHAGKAVIEGVRPANFSYELFGEVK